jgi:hypothetical protein
LAFPPIRKRGRSGSPQPQRGNITAPLHGATQADGVRAQLCASADPARREARAPAGQFIKRRTLKKRSGKECDPRKSRTISKSSRSSPEGPRLQAWCAKRVERVADRQRPTLFASYVNFSPGPNCCVAQIPRPLRLLVRKECTKQGRLSGRTLIVAKGIHGVADNDRGSANSDQTNSMPCW